MELKTAFSVVLDLASENSLDPDDFDGKDERLHKEALRQEEALNLVMEHYKTEVKRRQHENTV